MSSVIITGSQGFIGSYLVNEFLDAGYIVTGVDNYSKYGVVSRPHDDHPHFKLIQHDLKESFPIINADYIIAGAAMIGGISYFHKYAYDLLATNERILANTFDYAIDSYKHDQLKRIVVLSSSMVFENTKKYPTPEDEVSKAPPPSSTYGFQKLSSEYFAQGANEQYGVPYTIIRPFNCVGVGEEDAIGEEKVYSGNVKMLMSHVLPDLVHKALSLGPDDPLPILGDGMQVRHYTHGKDIARGIRLALESEDGVNNDFNISTSVSTSVRELAYVVWNAVHRKNPSIVSEPSYDYDVQLRSPDTSKAREILGFEANIGLQESVDEVVEYMRAKNG
jgi:nucleoside-diphosphate-sugar epimerase